MNTHVRLTGGGGQSPAGGRHQHGATERHTHMQGCREGVGGGRGGYARRVVGGLVLCGCRGGEQ